MAPLSNESKLKSDDTCPWSEEPLSGLLYTVAAQLPEEEHVDLINTSKQPATLQKPSEHKKTVKTLLIGNPFECNCNFLNAKG